MAASTPPGGVLCSVALPVRAANSLCSTKGSAGYRVIVDDTASLVGSAPIRTCDGDGESENCGEEAGVAHDE